MCSVCVFFSIGNLEISVNAEERLTVGVSDIDMRRVQADRNSRRNEDWSALEFKSIGLRRHRTRGDAGIKAVHDLQNVAEVMDGVAKRMAVELHREV